jgi:glycosyltransferase involved in cell wall biosynthesis
LGVDVTIRLSDETINYEEFDLLHFFNIIRPADILRHISRSGKPYVVSPIYVEYTAYERSNRKGIYGLIAKLLSSDNLEYAKAIARFFLNGEKIISLSYIYRGHYRSVRHVAKKARLLLPNSESEYTRFNRHYRTDSSYRVIPNAIDPALFQNAINSKRESNLLICVGRIEGRKNQLNLIRAVNNSRYQLIIIGSPSANQLAYYTQCKNEAALNVKFISQLTQQKLVEYYQRAKVHILPSWFETTGLSTMEAAAMGCNIVITDKGDTREYFENYAYYCDPSSPASILNAIEEASKCDFSEDLRLKIFNYYTWQKTAERTREAYLTSKRS